MRFAVTLALLEVITESDAIPLLVVGGWVRCSRWEPEPVTEDVKNIKYFQFCFV